MTQTDDGEISETDIAIVGMAGHFPLARNVREYWKNLRDGIEAVQTFTKEELLERGVPESLLRNPSYVRTGLVLPEMEHFDADFFGFSPKEAAILDPQHRHFLECTWEALEDAGYTPEGFEGAIGVFAGCGMGAYFAFNLLSNPALVDSVGLFLLRHTGNDKDFLSTRVSYNFDLKGPSVNVQTACSTSLVAVHLACQNLLSGECDMALAGGVTIELPHRRGYLYHEGEILSPDGHCRAFDHRSQGTIFGSGVGVVVLRRLADAIAAGDHVYAVIKGSAINNDGAGKVGYLAPSVGGQAAAIAEALSVAGVDADTVQYVECHGTGTPMGDPIEIAALTQAFRQTTEKQGYCAIGSVKTSIGHLDTAAGVASLIKVALALEQRQIPPTLNYEAPNPNIDFGATPFFVNAHLRDWTTSANAPRRAGVNSLGVGGTNAHVIVEEAPASTKAAARAPFQLLALSAKNRAALDQYSKELARHLREHEDQPLADVAFTLAKGRRAFAERRVLAVSSHEEAAALLEAVDTRRVFTHTAPAGKASVVFLLPGGGAQHPRMGRDLYESEPVYREHMDRGIAELQRRTGKDLRPLLFARDEDVAAVALELERPSLQLPAIFLVEYSLAKLWMSWGIEPSALLGHSMGENTAACLAGVMSFGDCLGLVSLRGDLFERVPAGGMLSVPLSETELAPHLASNGDGGLDLAAVNAPGLCVASGTADALDALAQKLAQLEIEARRIPIAIAAHSRLLDAILPDFRAYLKRIALKPPQIPFVSNRTGTWITAAQATDPEYWVAHLRSTIRFADGVKTLLADSSRVLLEVGPGKVLSSLARQHSDVRPTTSVLSSLRHADEPVSDVAFFTAVLGRLWASGVPIDLGRLWANEKRSRVSLPTYAFQKSRYWIEPGKPALAAPESVGPQKLEGFDEWFSAPVWKERALGPAPAATKQTWLVFLDDAHVGEALAARLKNQGHDVVTVRESDSYFRASANEYFLSPEHGREGYGALVRDLVAHGTVPAAVAHLWMVTESESFRPGSSFFHRNQERGFYSLFFLAQALSDEGVQGPLSIHVVANGVQSVAGEPLPYPDKATVLGPCRVIPREMPGVTTTAIDVALPGQGNGGSRKSVSKKVAASIADLLAAELAHPAANRTVAFRGGKRFEQAIERLAPSASAPKLRDGGVYLITGGLGGLGLVTAQMLAREHQAKLVLVARSPLPDRREWDAWLARTTFANATTRRIQKVRELEALGAEVLVAAADVTDIVALREVIEDATRRFGRIEGVFHTAGVLADGLIGAKAQAEVEEVFTPKVHGTLVLDALLAETPPDFCVLFSSTSAWIAPAGQVDYVAANAFLDAYAESKTNAGVPTIAVGWGVWNEVGMASEAAARSAHAPSDAPARTTPVDHPLYESRVDDARAQLVVTASYRPDTHWILDEHRTRAGAALVPGSGYFELIRGALEQCEKPVRPFEIRDLYFFRALAAPDGETKRVRARLVRSEEGYAFDLQTRVELGAQGGGWLTHAQARVVLSPLATPEPLDLAAIDVRCNLARLSDPVYGLRTKQEDHLRFGPRWRVVRTACYGAAEAIAELALPDAYHADVQSFGLHPALIDLATGFAMRLIAGYESSADLWVPVSYKSARVHGRLPARIVSWVRNHADNTADAAFALFDVTITDPAGNVLMDIEEFAIKRLGGQAEFGAAQEVSAKELERDRAAISAGRAPSPAEIAFQHNLEQGILPEEGQRALARVLAEEMPSRVLVSSLDVAALAEQANGLVVEAQREDDGAKFDRPALSSEFVAPRDDVERTLVSFFEELLGVKQVGVKDSFFDLGGHSLVAVRLFSKIKKAYQVEYPISVLFEAPTVEGCAALIKESIGPGELAAIEPAGAPKPRYTHLVKMHAGEGTTKTPFFLVAGMFGNVLNLRHLAQLVGAERPFYGLQARGLYGDHKPHETFEQMAEAYLAELVTVQPHGPYLLGGFSGGGITAFEMARQLRARGEEVSMLLMLDTPLPRSETLTARDKALIHWQRLTKGGHNYLFDWALGRFRWELGKIKKKLGDEPQTQNPAEFRSSAIEAAFRRALTLYPVHHHPGTITLFRPKLDASHVLGPGRVANKVRELVFHDNGWGAFCQFVDVHEVPGDHDSMVLEPNVRALAAKLRACLQDVEDRRAATRLAS